MHRYNEMKLVVLTYAAHHQSFTAAQLASHLNMPRHYARTYLLNYHRMSLLSRHKNHVYWYRLSQKGLERLQWLQSVMPEFYALLVS